MERPEYWFAGQGHTVKTGPVLDDRLTRPQRIYIIGGGGSGKTTLSRQLAPMLGLDLTELDGSSGAGERARGSRWVIEGIFVWGTAVWLERADLIIWLDLRWRVARRRIITRHLRLTAAGTNPHRGWRLLRQFLTSQHRYYIEPAREPAGPTDWDAITRAATARLVASHEAKVVVLRSPREVRRWRRAFARRWVGLRAEGTRPSRCGS
jgi:uridine kinase